MLQKFGIGIDIVKVERFQDKPYSKHKIFYKKIFLDSEIKYFLDIETYHMNSKPKIKLKNKLNYNFLVSLSHEKEFAIAVVVSEEFNVKKK